MNNFTTWNCGNAGNHWDVGDRNENGQEERRAESTAGPSSNSSGATQNVTRRRPPHRRCPPGVTQEQVPWPSIPRISMTWSYRGMNYSHFAGENAVLFGLYPPTAEGIIIAEPKPTEMVVEQVAPEPKPLYSEVVKRNLGKPVVIRPKMKAPKKAESPSSSNHVVDELEQELQCAVCFNLLRKPVFSVVPCSHKFCRNCIMRWMHEDSKPTACPTCRVVIREVIHDIGFSNILDIYTRSNPDKKRPDCPPLEEEGLLHGPIRLDLIPPDDDALDIVLALAVDVRHLLNAPLCLENIVPLHDGMIQLCDHLNPIIHANLERLRELGILFHTLCHCFDADDEYSEGDSEADDEEDEDSEDEKSENEDDEEADHQEGRDETDEVDLSSSDGSMAEDELSEEATSDKED